ncbi:ABC transporter ATP-binding protein [Halostella sp. JP-L12]|uniref:ABC transporter ATP-binding protein n=1 Tax=Halostella TaxID=1843185 RepID=UPI000EF84EC2|nr:MULTISPECIES: ABC transporter ATP-binding protein [Halostella]NHN49339.1 ABC transporter ATP-binding protein [Halostella sp. JP-L12]
MAKLRTENLVKRFGNLVAVDDVSLSVEDGELWCLLGPSGCGKSTTLRMLGGLDQPTDGSILIGDEEVTQAQPYNRNTSMVFQSWALFPHKTVLENVTFGLKMDGVGKEERIERAEEYLEMVQMGEFTDSSPRDLSGGQQQRVALARSLAMDPDVLLLDEPLSNLDKRLREEMQIELKRIHDELDKTMVHVTHDQDEAFTLADRIGIMNAGELVQVGKPREVYANPKNQFIEEFLGDTNFLSTTVTKVGADRIAVKTESGDSLDIPVSDATSVTKGDIVTVSLRPEILSIETETATTTNAVRSDGAGGQNSFQGEVTTALYRGSSIRHYLDVGGQELFIERDVGRGENLGSGDVVTITWDPADVLCFDENEERLA